jgi:hypothetical protein
MFKKKIELVMVFLLITGACTLVASANQTNDSGKYTFTNYGGEVYTPEPMEFGANINETENITLRNGTERKHILIQFYDNPTDEQYEMLPNYGVKYLTSAAPYTLISSMPADLTAADLPAESGLRWMGEIPIENKYDRYFGLDVPEWARLEDGNIQLAVRFYNDVTYQNALDTLNQYSNNITNFSYSLEIAYEIITNENNITLIASEDSVMYLGYRNDDTIDETDFVDYEEITKEDESDIVEEQENNSQETAENINDSEEKENPGFTATIAILIFVLITVLGKRK